MPTARCNGIAIAYELSGPRDGAPLLLIHGVGAQLVRWPEALLAAFGAARFRVVRFDNRDVGLSTHLDDMPPPDLAEIAAARQRGETPSPPYTIADMAVDAVGLLDALGIDRAHVLGVSLGGMIAQTMAVEHPGRLLSLTILMSRTGNPAMPASDPALLALLATPAPDPHVDHGAYLDHSLALNRALGSPAYPAPEAGLRAMAAAAASRGYDPGGSARQLAASRAMPDLRERLQRLTLPTLVIHGADDRLIPPACGEDIARNVSGAWLFVAGGMGHDLPAELFDLFVSLVERNAARVGLDARA